MLEVMDSLVHDTSIYNYAQQALRHKTVGELNGDHDKVRMSFHLI